MIVPRREWLDESENSDLYCKDYISNNLKSWERYLKKLEKKEYKTKHKQEVQKEAIDLCIESIKIDRELLEKISLKNKDFYKKSYSNKRSIESHNEETREKLVFPSKNAAAKHFQCSPAMVYFICEKKNNCHSLKKGGVNITFKYAPEPEPKNDE